MQIRLNVNIESLKTDRKSILRYDAHSLVKRVSDRIMKLKYTPTVHDAAFKGFMTQVGNARDFFDIHLPEHIKALCDFSTLALTNSSFIDDQLYSRLSDVLYSVQTTEGEGYVYLVLEHLCGAPHKCSYAKKMIM